jgi:hypothetical protein
VNHFPNVACASHSSSEKPRVGDSASQVQCPPDGICDLCNILDDFLTDSVEISLDEFGGEGRNEALHGSCQFLIQLIVKWACFLAIHRGVTKRDEDIEAKKSLNSVSPGQSLGEV